MIRTHQWLKATAIALAAVSFWAAPQRSSAQSGFGLPGSSYPGSSNSAGGGGGIGTGNGGVGIPSRQLYNRSYGYTSITGSGTLTGPLIIQSTFGGTGGQGGAQYGSGSGTYQGSIGGVGGIGGSGGAGLGNQGAGGFGASYSMFPAGFQLHFAYNTLVGLPSAQGQSAGFGQQPPQQGGIGGFGGGYPGFGGGFGGGFPGAFGGMPGMGGIPGGGKAFFNGDYGL